MLMSLETVPDASPVEVPPLYDQKPMEAALRAGNGNYVFSSDNEVLFFGDELMENGYVKTMAQVDLLTPTCLQGNCPA